MNSKKGYFIDIDKGEVETAEEHDRKVLNSFASCVLSHSVKAENGFEFVEVDTILKVLKRINGDNYEKGGAE